MAVSLTGDIKDCVLKRCQFFCGFWTFEHGAC